MQIPLQVTFEGSDPLEPVRAAIEREVKRLEKHNGRIIGCRVAVIAPSQKHRHGSDFRLQFHRTKTLRLVNHTSSDDKGHEHIEVAVKDAFAAARRQVDDLAQQS